MSCPAQLLPCPTTAPPRRALLIHAPQAVLVDCDAGQRRSLMDLLQRYRCVFTRGAEGR